MHRREFLGLLAAMAAAGGVAPAGPRLRAAAIERLPWWIPAPQPPFPPLPPLTLLEWRYLAGRITEGADDYGFIVSLGTYRLPLRDPPQLLVMRQDLRSNSHTTRTYPGVISYTAADASYSFVADQDPSVTATWRLDTTSQRYTLSVASPELTLSGLSLEPVGDLVAEAGTGRITTAVLGGANVASNYHADWLALRRGATTLGYGRLDMQTIDVASIPSTRDFTFSHHWFAAAATLANGEEVWIAAWRLVSEVTTWVATVARRRIGDGWNVASYNELTPAFAAPVAVQILAWQAQPVAANEPPQRTGQAWRVTAGLASAADLLDLTFRVAPGQFITGARVASGLTSFSAMQEAMTLDLSGSVGGQPLASVRFAVAESTYSEPAPAEEPTKLYLPLVQR